MGIEPEYIDFEEYGIFQEESKIETNYRIGPLSSRLGDDVVCKVFLGCEQI